MVHLDLKEKGHSFKDVNVDQDGRWFERGLKEAVYVDCEGRALNRDCGL